jgi:hypothetical protein
MSVEPDENEEHLQIIKADSIFDFNEFEDAEINTIESDEEKYTQINEYIDEASQQAFTQSNLEEVEEQKEESKQTEIAKQSIIVSSEVRRSSRPQKLSPILIENKEQEEERISISKLDNELKEAKRKEAKKREEDNKKLLANVGSIRSVDGNETDASTATIATSYIIPNIRLETYNPTSQASMIFDQEFMKGINGETLCSLCGFKLKDRVSYWHNKIHNPTNLEKLTWSYDHFVPVNFSAVVFRIPTSKSTFTPIEKEYLKNIGHIACYHCNYEKSQRMFITCPVKGKKDFNNFQPNEDSITLFVHDLYKSQNKNGWSKEGDEIKRTLTKCLTNEKKHYVTWIRQRIGAIRKLAQNVCNIIKNNTNHTIIKQRHKLARIIIAKADQSLISNDEYKCIKKNKKKISFRKNYIANLFASAELNFPKPWKEDSVIDSSKLEIIEEEPEVESIPSDMTSTVRRDEKIDLKIKRDPPIDSRKKRQFSQKTKFAANFGSSRKRKNKRKTYRRIRLF